MIERRCAPRSRTYLGGRALFNRRFTTADCLVRDRSEAGARLVFDAPVSLPAEFEVMMTRNSEIRKARTVWRTDRAVGVEFVKDDAGRVASPISLEVVRRLRDSEAEAAKLKRRVDELTSGA